MRRVLVIKLGALGDLVMATGLLHAILAHEREAQVSLLTTPAYAPLFAGWPGLRVAAFPRKGLLAGLRVLRWLRGQHFDRIYDLQSNDRTRLWCALAGASERVGNHPVWPYTHHPSEPWHGQCHIFERMLAVLAAAGVPTQDALPRLPAEEATRRGVEAWLEAHGLQQAALALCHAGSSPAWPAKRWPHFAELAHALAARGLAVVWLGAGQDAGLNASLARAVGIDATGAFDLAGLAELGRRARFALTNDSGPMHVLAAAGLPVYGFFGPTDWRRNHAIGQAGRVLRNQAPCPACASPHRAAAAGHLCLPGISAASVLARLERDGLLGPAQAPSER